MFVQYQDVLIAATVKRFGKSSAYVDCSVSFVGSGGLVAHAVLDFAFREPMPCACRSAALLLCAK